MVSSPTTIFFPVWFNFDSVLFPSPPKPLPECCLCRSVSAYVSASFCLCPCAAVGPDHSLTGFGMGVLSRAVVGCGDRSLPGLPCVPPLYSSMCPVQLFLLALGRMVSKKRVSSSIHSPTLRKWRMDFRTPEKKGQTEGF